MKTENNKKEFETPKIEIIEINAKDVITTSDQFGGGQAGDTSTESPWH